MDPFFQPEYLSGFFLLIAFLWIPHIFYLLASLIHEMGHAFLAKIVGAENIQVQVGYGGKLLLKLSLNLLKFKLFNAKDCHGTTSYKLEDTKKKALILVTLGGPLFSLCFSMLTIYLLHSFYENLGFGFQIGLIIVFITNAKFFILSAIPKVYPANKNFPCGWKTDGQIIHELLKKKNDH